MFSGKIVSSPRHSTVSKQKTRSQYVRRRPKSSHHSTQASEWQGNLGISLEKWSLDSIAQQYASNLFFRTKIDMLLVKLNQMNTRPNVYHNKQINVPRDTLKVQTILANQLYHSRLKEIQQVIKNLKISD